MKIENSKGFTLIELMMVVGLIGIISAVAFGYYGDSVISAKRTDGRKALTETAASLEKCRSLYGSYNSPNCNVALPFTTDDGLYTVSLVATASTYTLTAAAAGAQAVDAECTAMTLTNTGVKAGTPAAANECW